MRPLRYAVPAALLVLAGCSSDADSGTPPDADGPSTTGSATGSSTATPAPAPDWQPVDGPVDRAVTRNARGTELTGATHRETFLTETHSLVVEQDPEESEPARAVLTDLESGEESVLDGDSEVPTTTGGTWALGPESLVHATVAPAGSYCLATVELDTLAATRNWCAPQRHGFTGARITDAGTTLQTFDDARPSCRTVGTVEGTEVVPFADAPACTAWDALVLDSGPVWSVVRNERNIEQVDLFAQGPGGPGDVVELGAGTSGTLVGCGGAAYFVRDPQNATDPARLVRWDGTSTEVVYESPAGPAFLETPRCGGDVLTLTAYAEGGDEQVSARLR
jgi:hypothetical protein